eukprot:m.190172 g.190172  ORF g.190172 m.190172 type:complete len:367 (+) comp18545_c1_seq7:348-1448(+)
MGLDKKRPLLWKQTGTQAGVHASHKMSWGMAILCSILLALPLVVATTVYLNSSANSWRNEASQQHVVVAGGVSQDSVLSSAEYLKNGKWMNWVDMTCARELHMAVSGASNHIIVMGGTPCGHTHVWNGASGQWDNTSSPGDCDNVQRIGAQAVQIGNDRVFVVGGTTNANDGVAMATVEQFQIAPCGIASLNDSTAIPAMSSPRVYFGAGLVPGGNSSPSHLVVAGGSGGGGADVVGTVEVLDLVANTWEPREGLTMARSAVAMATVANVVYVLGGRDADNRVVGVLEALDVSNTTNPWTTLAPMNTNRAFHAAAVVDGWVCAFGGMDDQGQVLADVECYSPSEDKWETRKSMQTARANFTATIIG